MKLALVDDPIFLEHRARGYHPERPERLLAARDAAHEVEADGVELAKLPARDASPDEIHRVHTAAYVEELERHHGLFGALDDDTYLGPRSIAAAYRASGGALALVDALLDPSGPNQGVALVRPPGHHAKPGGGMGFCLLNNIAIAAAHARSRGVRRVAIVDWDVHHGNGTQDAFFADPSVLFVSLHQYPFYPGTGMARDVGEGEGRGYTVNVPLSPNAVDETYRAAFERVVLPVLEEYAPELVLVSAGFDAHARDPLAGMALTHDGFGWMAQAVRGIADRSAGGRVGVLLEGGYDLEGLESSLAATLRGILRGPSAASGEADSDVGPISSRHSLEIEQARKSVEEFWKV